MSMHHKLFVFFFVFMLSSLMQSCAKVDAGQNEATSVSDKQLISRAKQATKKFKLTEKSLECFIFEINDKKFEGKTLVNAREIHNSKCGGDPGTSPRAFSVGFDEKTGEIWSDAHSMLGLMEKLGKE